MTPQEAAKEILARDDAKAHLLPFIEYTHHNWQSGAHHKLICDKLEAVERGEIKRLLICTPPRHSKSEIATKRFPAWYLGRNPDKQVICCSYNDEIATDFGRDVRNLVTDQLFKNVHPGVSLAPDATAAGRWVTNKGGIYTAAGVGGTITGRGAHIAIIDDPLKNREEADSERIRDTIWKWYTSTLYTRLMPGGAIILICTRWHEDDLAARVIESEKWEQLILPAISNDKALWPEWYDLATLKEKRDLLMKSSPRDWYALYQQEPRSEQGTYIQREWFKERWIKKPSPVNVYMSADFAVAKQKEGKDPDWTEIGVFGITPNDKINVIDWWGGQTTSDQWIERLIDLFEKHRPLCFFGEGGVIRHAIEPFLVRRMRERKVYCRLEWLNPIHDKSTDGRAFQARAAMGNVVLPQGVEWAERILSQWVGFPGAKKDDAFDCIAKMCRAIDEAHSAVLSPAEAKPKERDYDLKPMHRIDGYKAV